MGLTVNEDEIEPEDVGIDDSLTITEGECVFISMESLYAEGVVCVWMAEGGPCVGVKGRGVLTLDQWLKGEGAQKVASLRPV